ncbi:ORF-12 [Agrotis segetum nucleopolyhedrovirus A]|uniref:ORF-12 n=1 Tax=Agrotis segetum nuclear polyhedrosis virus TaxID=1962501 RepID=Q287R0_NPVAS|nr:ORF-12 [Agrotis segetum nucleopolyhedrovirus A]AAZ38178.1 ORF-12 [Agrotis segetum nucleopolyhedrovirus A]
MFYSPRYNYRGTAPYSYSTLISQHDDIRHDLRTLKSQMYEICQQSTADRSLCDRIKSSSLDTTYYPLSNRTRCDSDVLKISTTTTNRNLNTANNGAAVKVVDTIKY